MSFIVKITVTVSILILTVFSNLDAQNSNDPEDLISAYYNEDFEPFAKGNGFVGLSFSLTDDKSTNSTEVFGFDQIVTREILDWSIDLKGGYFIGKNSMLGLGYEYVNESTDTRIRFVSDTLFTTKEGKFNGFTPFIRSYFPLTKNKRLSLFNEFRMNFAFGNATDSKLENSVETEAIETDIFRFGVGLSPGITFFAIENFAFEIQLDVLGYEFEKETISTNTGEETTRTSNNIDFTLSLLSLEFGLAYYIR